MLCDDTVSTVPTRNGKEKSMKKILLCSLSCLMVLLLCSCGILFGDKFVYNDLGDSFEFAGRGDSTDAEIEIPAEHKGKPVTAIGNKALYYNMLGSMLSEEDVPAITSVTLPDTITKIGREAFANNRQLKSVNIPASVTSIGAGAFYECASLTSITLPDGLTEISEAAFFGCAALTSITIPESVTTIYPSAFEGCKSLTSVTLPSGITTIPEDCFADCTSLTTVNITGITAIEDEAFEGCVALKELTIPTTLTTLGSQVFADTAETLTINVYFDEKAPEGWDEACFDGMTGKVLNTSKVYYDNVVVPNLSKAEELQAAIDSCNEQYKELNEEIGRLNEASKPYQASGNMDMIRHYRDQINSCKDQQRSVLNRRDELKEQLENCPITNQIN